MSVKLRFLGAAQNVTGSCYLLEGKGFRVIVDCGLYQERNLKERNWRPFPVDPKSIQAVLLTHGHLDHCGLLPKLVREGFRGKIYCTPATAGIARIVLLDSAKLQVEDAQYKKKRHEKEGRHGAHPEVPLYTEKDAQECFPLFLKLAYESPVTLTNGLQVTFHDAGHILGSSMIKVLIPFNGKKQRTMIFSGDIGRWNAPILKDPTLFHETDYIIMESTYGNRLHKENSTIPKDLADVINKTHSAGGNIVIPSFAVERTQELLYHLSKLLRNDEIPHLMVFLDSPMAVRITQIFAQHQALFDEETLEMIRNDDHPCDFPGLVMCRTTAESKAINHIRGTVVIIAGSGMCTGGRIKHHLINNITRSDSTILFVGYQAENTLGRTILDGASQVRILGEHYPVRAQIRKINGFSAHADRNELYRWVSALEHPPRQIFITHGEPDAATGFSSWLKEKTGWQTSVASYMEEVELQ